MLISFTSDIKKGEIVDRIGDSIPKDLEKLEYLAKYYKREFSRDKTCVWIQSPFTSIEWRRHG